MIVGGIILAGGVLLLVFNIFPSMGGKYHTHPVWGRIAGAGIILMVFARKIFPEYSYSLLIIGPLTLIVLVIAFLADINRSRAR